MNSFLKLSRIGGLALLAVLLAACGGGSKKSLLYGTASVGAPLAYTPVTITDANGKSVTVTTTPNGTFAINATDMQGPLLLKSGINPFGLSQPLYSVLTATPQAGTNLTANLTPLTTAVVALLRADGNPNNITLADITSAGVTAAIGKLNGGVLASLLVTNGLTTNGLPAFLDPITTIYYANNIGIDGLNSEVHLVTQADGSLALVPNSNPNQVLQADGSLALLPTSDPTQSFVLKSGTATPTTPFNNPPFAANSTTLPVAANYLDWLATELKNCLATADLSRYSSAYCNGIFDPHFMSSGLASDLKTASFDTTLAASFPDFVGANSVGATFGAPQTLSFLTVTTPGLQLATVRIPITMKDGTTRKAVTMTVRQIVPPPAGATAFTVLPDNVSATWTIYSN